MAVDRQVALIRGINVGKAKRIAMSDLRALFEDLGFTEVKTLLNSGNVVFTVPKSVRKDPARSIETAIAAEIGVTARVTVLKAAELAEIVAANKLVKTASDDSRLMVTVLIDKSHERELRDIEKRDWGMETFLVGAHATYSWCPNGALDSPLMTAVGKVLRDGATTRNWATIKKLGDAASIV